MNWDWKHTALTVCGVLAAVSEGLAHYAASGGALPWHLSAASFLAATMVFGHISTALGAPTGSK